MNKPTIFYRNYTILLQKGGIKQNYLTSRLNISQGATWRWKEGSIPQLATLKNLAEFFSQALNIPYELFRHGQALLEDDFELIIKNLSNVRKNETSATNLQYKQESISPDECEPLSQDEIEFLLQLRKGARTKYPLSRATLDRIQETVALLGGPDSSQHLQAIEFLRFFSRGWENAPQRAKESRGPGSSDRKQ